MSWQKNLLLEKPSQMLTGQQVPSSEEPSSCVHGCNALTLQPTSPAPGSALASMRPSGILFGVFND